MTYRGRIHNGVVVFEGNPPLREGTVVEIQALEESPSLPPPGSREAVLRADGIWADDAEEMDRLLEEVQKARDADLALERSRKP